MWGSSFDVESHDLKKGKDIFNLPDDYGKAFDLVIAAPPCRQFTIANNRNWHDFPVIDVLVVKKCLKICLNSGRPWILETTIGRIEKLIPDLVKYRIGIWQSRVTTKKHTVYSNMLLLFPIQKGIASIVDTRSVKWRESWQQDFIDDIKNSLINESTN